MDSMSEEWASQIEAVRKMEAMEEYEIIENKTRCPICGGIKRGYSNLTSTGIVKTAIWQ